MEPDSKKPQPERDQTDESLRTERANSDQAMAEKRSDLQESTDQLVERARDKANTVLDAAREKADHKLDEAEASVHGREIVARERAEEDEAVRSERAAADEQLRRERFEQARTLAALLPLERDKTDRYLLTERTRSDDALEQRDDFMGMVSHDLRNLLSGIALSATLLSEEASESDEGRRTVTAMKRMQRYVARMNRLIGDLVDIVSIDAGKLAVQPARGDVAALMTEALEAFAEAALANGIALECEAVVGALMADFDHDRMLQVLANLITNALKFTPRGGRIAIRGERDGDALRLSVSDTGIGIADDLVEAVFERFWQVGKNDKRGLGLGLYISRCIVDAHGGRIWVESKMGKGSVFQLTLPADAGARARRQSPMLPAMSSSINPRGRVRDVLVIGASAGGIPAVIELLSRLPAEVPAVIGVVIHRGPTSHTDWSAMLGRKTSLRVVQPADGDRLARGIVYVAPADCHMTFSGGKVHLDRGPKQQYTRPAVNRLFTSAALAYGPRVVGVVLTGAGQDGLQGLIDIKAAGGISLVQSPDEAEHASMPEHAIIGDHVDAVLGVKDLGDALDLLARGAVVNLQ